MSQRIISLQKQVREDIFKILKESGFEPQYPEYVAIMTEDEVHFIYFYPYNKEVCFGCYKNSIKNLSIPVNYSYDDLKRYIEMKIGEDND